MARLAQSAWERFKESAEPLCKPREVKQALPKGPGLDAYYSEYHERGTMLGIPVLAMGRNLFLPRRQVIEKIEGRN